MIRGDPKSVDQEFPLLICADRRKDLCRQLPEASCETGMQKLTSAPMCWHNCMAAMPTPPEAEWIKTR